MLGMILILNFPQMFIQNNDVTSNEHGRFSLKCIRQIEMSFIIRHLHVILLKKHQKCTTQEKAKLYDTSVKNI